MVKKIQSTKKTTELVSSCKAFIGLMLIWLGILLLLSVIELLLSGFAHEFPTDSLSVLAWAWIADVLYWVKWLWLSCLIFMAIAYFNKRAALVFFSIGIAFLAIMQLLLISYFYVSLVPLGGDFFSYSYQDIKQTVGASGGLSTASIVAVLLILSLVIAAIVYLPAKLKPNTRLAIALPIVSLIFAIFGVGQWIKPANLKSDFANNLAINKSAYFLSASYDRFFPALNEVDIYADSYIGDFEGVAFKPKTFSYVAEQTYPFLHKDETPDVLSPYFNVGKAKPNIVILLVEGLGRAFTNEGAYLGNFTPFIDSLAQKSLYWKNFLSQGGRTFAVLPSLMGSLPFGESGFLELGAQMPDHLSLYNILKHNGYHTSFYYGGESKFDNMNVFLRKNKVDEIRDGSTFPSSYQKLPSQNGFTWGYADDQLFGYYLNTLSNQQPNLNVILTVATHNPFLINNESKYLQLFEKRMTQLGFDAAKKSNYRNYQLQYASILYTDEAIKNFFAQYQKRSDFNNTIFVITGDHRMPEIPMQSKIDRYHVPLLIYSPMLKRTAEIQSISAHVDIVPSMLAFLKHHYQIETPTLTNWIGDGLDTNKNFRNIHSYPLIQTKSDLVDFVMGEYHLNQNSLFKLGTNMVATPETDPAILNQLKTAFENFKKRNQKITASAKLYPDSVLKKYQK